tara:strand:+ start:589 stop:1071 length:483 start_codon:yes stop_codon:yes gene_type:complete
MEVKHIVVVELILERKLGPTEKEIKVKLKNRLAENKGKTEPSKEEDLSKYDPLIKTITITSFLDAALIDLIFLEIDDLSGTLLLHNKYRWRMKMLKVDIKGRKLSLDELAFELEESSLSTEDQIEALSQVLKHGVLKDAPRVIKNWILYHQRYGNLNSIE